MSEKLEFSSFQLYIGDNFAKKSDFTELKNSYQFNIDEKYYTVKIELTDTYLYIYSLYGEPNPHPRNVFNTDRGLQEENPRQDNQVEQDKQFFACYDFDSYILYLSNQKSQKSFLMTLLSDKLQKDNINIKSVFKDINEFYKEITSISKIKFTSIKKDLFSSAGCLQQSLQDNYGIEEPEEFYVEAKFNTSIVEKIKKVINLLTKQKDEGYLKKVIIQGIDDNGFEKVFNEEKFIKKFDIITEKDEQKLFISDYVKTLILKKIGIEE